MTNEPANGATLLYRVDQAEREIGRLWKEAARARDVEKLFGDVEQKASVRDLDNVLKALEKNTAETNSLRKTILAFTVTLATASVVFALSVLQGGLS